MSVSITFSFANITYFYLNNNSFDINHFIKCALIYAEYGWSLSSFFLSAKSDKAFIQIGIGLGKLQLLAALYSAYDSLSIPSHLQSYLPFHFK